MSPRATLSLLVGCLAVFVGFDLFPLLSGETPKLSDISIAQLGAVGGAALAFLLPKTD